MKTGYLKIIAGMALLCLICTQLAAATPTPELFDQLGADAATLAMDQLGFEYGDPDVVVLTDAGRVLVDGQTTEKAISGITRISGLQNSDGTLFQINRAEWKPLWFYFYNKDTGKALYLVPDNSYYELSDAAATALPAADAFGTAALVTGDIDMMLADTDDGNRTEEILGGDAFSIVSLSNAWSHGAPYDLMTAAAFHDHFCPGVSSGYLIVKYIEDLMPLTDDTSYVVISNPTWCKEDIYPTLWDMTPGKGGVASSDVFTDEDQAELTEKYGIRPAGIFVLWNSTSNTGDGVAVGFNFDSSEWTGPAWGQKISQTVDMVENLDHPENYINVTKTFSVDEQTLSELQNPLNNPYEVIGMI